MIRTWFWTHSSSSYFEAYDLRLSSVLGGWRLEEEDDDDYGAYQLGC
jgi:hypothetical protein